MAELGALSIGVKVDLSQLNRDLAAMQASLKTMSSNTNIGRDLNTAFKSAETGADSAEKAISDAEKTVTKTGNTAKTVKAPIVDLSKAFGDAGKVAGSFKDAIGAIPLVGGLISGPMSLASSAASALGDALKSTGDDANTANKTLGEMASGAVGALADAAASAGTSMATLAVGIAGTVTAIGVMSAVVGPLIIGLTGLVTVTSAWLVAMTAAVGVVGLVFGSFALGIGGVLALNAALGTNQTQMGELKNMVTAIGDAFVKVTTPALNGVVVFLRAFMPQLTQFATTIGTALNSVMGPLLNIGGYILKDIMSWVVQLIPSFQQWLGIISTNMPEFNQLFNLLMQMGTQALVGLVNNGLKLVDWVSKLVGNTTGMTIVNQTFGLMGNIVQYVAGVVGNMVGWFINNWPTITSLVQEVTGAFVALSPQITWAAGQFQAIWNQFSQNQQFKDGIQAIANVCAGALVVGINLAVGAFQTMATTITLVGAAVDGIGWYFNQLGTDIQNGLASAEDIIDSFISGFNSAFGGMGLEITMPTWGHTYQLGAAQTRTGVYAANSGGLVPGGGPNRDSTLMYLTPGEYVIDRNTTQALGLGAGPSNIAGLIGAIGGQCLAWVSQMTGLYRGVPMAADLIPDINSEIPKIGELAVFSGAAVGNTAGHVGFVEGLNPLTLLDSNWSNDGVIREHTIPANLPTGYIDIGASTLPGLNLPNLLSGLLGQFHGTGFFGGVVNNLLGKIGNAAIGTFDNGGTLLPGALAYNASSRPEMVRSAAQEDELGAKLDRIAELLTGGVGGPTVNVHGAAPTPQEIIGAMTWAQYSRA